MDCPQCNKPVPAKLHWAINGAKGSVCPHCQANLCPRAICAVVLFFLSCGLADAALILLRRAGAEFWLALLAFFVVFAAAYLAGLRLIMRLRVKAPAEAGFGASRV